MTQKLEIRDFDVREADWERDQATLSHIRRLVFIVEQGVPQEEEWDGRDDDSHHWLATDASGGPIGTARLLPEGQIGRMAVLPEFRGYGVGAALLERAVEKARYLGFTEVFLHAQTHALGFYERAGFSAEGDEFMDAGIPHLQMKRQLDPPSEGGQRALATAPVPDVSIRRFDAIEVDWLSAGKAIRKIREGVFVVELGLGREIVTDDVDADAIHWHAASWDGQIIGAVRMDLSGTVNRLAVQDHFRHQGVGSALLELAVARARRYGYPEIRLVAPPALDAFWRTAGFAPRGDPVTHEGQRQQEYVRSLEYEEIFNRPKSPLAGENYQSADTHYRLGQDNKLLLLRKDEEFRNVIQQMATQASQSIRIFSPLLDHALFNQSALRDICSALARRNKHTRIEILVYDPHRIIKNGHLLLELSRKLPTSVNIKVVDPEMRQLNHEFVLVDDYGLVFRHDYEKFEGYANFYDKTESGRLGRTFRAAWESGLLDPNLRQLRL